MSRRAARKDDNHNDIADALRAVGAAVKDTHSAPGLLDMLCGYRGRLYWIEIKDGAKVASKRRLTPAEQATIAAFARVGCAPVVVESADEALRLIGAVE